LAANALLAPAALFFALALLPFSNVTVIPLAVATFTYARTREGVTGKLPTLR
jgi:hypothetical protein